jgi:hypothetical protein
MEDGHEFFSLKIGQQNRLRRGAQRSEAQVSGITRAAQLWLGARLKYNIQNSPHGETFSSHRWEQDPTYIDGDGLPQGAG